MQVTRTIVIEWWKNGKELEEVDKQFANDLTEAGFEHANQMLNDGYSCGELNHTAYSNGQEVTFKGWWKFDDQYGEEDSD